MGVIERSDFDAEMERKKEAAARKRLEAARRRQQQHESNLIRIRYIRGPRESRSWVFSATDPVPISLQVYEPDRRCSPTSLGPRGSHRHSSYQRRERGRRRGTDDDAKWTLRHQLRPLEQRTQPRIVFFLQAERQKSKFKRSMEASKCKQKRKKLSRR